MTPGPLGTLTGLRLVAAYAVREISQSRKTIFVAVLLLLPAVLSVVIRRKGDLELDVFTTVVPNIYFVAMVPLACLFFGGSVVRDALEEKKLPFLITRPQGRARTLLGLYLGMVAVVAVLLLTSILVTYAACRVGIAGGVVGEEAALGALGKIAGVLLAAGAFYGALFTVLGLVTRWPTVVGILWILVVEGSLGSMPGPPRALAPSGYFETLLTPEFTTRASLGEMEQTGPWTAGFSYGHGQAAVTLLVVFALLVAAIVVFARGKDFLPYEKPRSRG